MTSINTSCWSGDDALAFMCQELDGTALRTEKGGGDESSLKGSSEVGEEGGRVRDGLYKQQQS